MSIIKLAKRRDIEEAFTLLELIIVVVIIGILAAIAIPIGLEQQKRAWASTAQSDVRNIATDIERAWNEDEGYPLGTSSPLSPSNSVNFYADGEFVSSAGDDYEIENGSSGNGSGGGSQNGTGGNGGSNTTTYRPATNRYLTWAEFKAANRYDTGNPAFSFNGSSWGTHLGVDQGRGWVNGYNFSSTTFSSLSAAKSAITRACQDTTFGYFNYVPENYNDLVDAGAVGQNLCYALMEGTPEQQEGALNALGVTETDNSTTNYNVPYYGLLNNTRLTEYDFANNGSYSVLISRVPITIFGGHLPFQITDTAQLPYQGDSSGSYTIGGQYYSANYLYDIYIFHTSNTDSAKSSTPRIAGNDDFQGGRMCPDNQPGMTTFCTGGNSLAGLPFYQAHDLSEAWWRDYVGGSNGSGGSGSGPTTTPDANGGVKADASNNTYAASFCVEGFNANVPDEWFFYSSETKKVQKGRCPVA